MAKKLNPNIFKQLLLAAYEPIVITDQNGLIVYVNRQAEHFFGYKSSELIGQLVEILIPRSLRKKHTRLRKNFMSEPSARPMGTRTKLVGRHREGHRLSIDISLTPLKTKEGELFIAAIIHDMTAYRFLEEKLLIQANRDNLTGLMNKRYLFEVLQYALNLVSRNKLASAICFIDLDNFKYINDTYGHGIGDLAIKAVAQRLTQNLRSIDLIARLGGDEFACVISNIKKEADLLLLLQKLQHLFQEPFKIENQSFEISASIGVSLYPLDGRTGKVLLEKADAAMYQAKHNGKNQFVFYTKHAFQQPIGIKKAHYTLKEEGRWIQNKIQYLQAYDVLTGFKNFKSIRADLQQLIECSPQRSIALLLIGIDNFKIINDIHGCDSGDLILGKVSKKISKVVEKEDLLARKSGDEFFVVLSAQELPQVIRKAENLLKVIAKPIRINKTSIRVTVSIGISTYPNPAQNCEALLKHADIALNQAKLNGKNNYQFFSETIGNEVHYLHQLQTDLMHALARNEFVLYYQPLIDLKGQCVFSAEALLRWQHPTLGLISPNHFIPIAEKTGDIVSIGNWVLMTACMEAESWPKTENPISVSVNIAAKQLMLHSNASPYTFYDLVKTTLINSGLKPEQLILEITEGILIESEDPIINTLKQLKELGVHLACDDFGNGYSSLGRLKQIPLDVIKIDRSLIQDLGKVKSEMIIVRSIISLANQLNIKTVAEGVETKEQYEILFELGCEVIQGNYCSLPLLPAELRPVLKREFKAD